MAELLNITQAANYLNVSQDTLRKWDKLGKLKPLKTAGGHRRYDVSDLDEFIGKKSSNSYGNLYEHLCSAQLIADELKDDVADEIMKIRQLVGEKLLRKQGFVK
jgi:excisionase family DNA binding protein